MIMTTSTKGKHEKQRSKCNNARFSAKGWSLKVRQENVCKFAKEQSEEAELEEEQSKENERAAAIKG